MVDGVTLITTETISSGGFLFPAVVAAIGCIATIILCTLSIEGREWGAVFVCTLVGIILCFASIYCFDNVFNPRQEEQYLVQLEDKISSEFVDKYDIIERKDNNVYVIKERDAND